MANRWEYDFWSSPLKACLPPEGRILRRVCRVLKKNQNAPRPSDVILCLDCRRIALIGRCLVKNKKMIGSCLLKFKDFGWYMRIHFRDFDWYMPIEICPAHI